MSNQLIRTKLFIPPFHPESVLRPRLLERLNSGLMQKLILISASAGSGKSTLLSQWIHRCKIPAAWFSIDEEDNDQTRFMVYFISALQTLFPGIDSSSLAIRQTPQPESMEADLINLINEISLLPDHFVLVLDDYHLIKSEYIHKAMTFFIDHLPTQMHLAVATRSDPPLPLALLLSRGQMVEIRSNDLRFTADEAQQFLGQTLKNKLTDEEVNALETRTEGWVAGLRLAAVSLQGLDAENIENYIKAFTGSNRYVLDYLIEEVLQQQPQKTQEFLCRTSILKHLSAPLCDAVTGQENSQSMLEYIEHSNMFIEPLDDKRCWYRYHNLFADLLHLRLQQYQPELINTLHSRASQWYEQNNMIPSAIYHALAIQNYPHAAQLIEEESNKFIKHGEVETLKTWLAALPSALFLERPELTLIEIWVKIVKGDLNNLEQKIEHIETALREKSSILLTDERRQNLLTQITGCRAYLALHSSEFPLAIEMSKRAVEMSQQITDSQSVNVPFFTIFYHFFSKFDWLLNTDPEELLQSSMRLLSEVQDIGNNLIAILTIYMAAYKLTINGSLNQAKKLYELCLQNVEAARNKNGSNEKKQRLSPAISLVYQGLGDILRRQNQLEEATFYLTECLKIGERWGNIEILFDNYVAFAFLQLAKGDIQGTGQTFLKIRALPNQQHLSPVSMRQMNAYLAQFNVRQGNLTAAKEWAKNLQEYDPKQYGNKNLSYLFFGIEQIILAGYLIACRQFEQALEQLDKYSSYENVQNKIFPWFEFRVQQMMAYLGMGDSHKAKTLLMQVLEKATEEDYIRVFIDEGKPMAHLLSDVKKQFPDGDSKKTFIDKLLENFELETPSARLQKPSATPIQPQTNQLIEPLSEREIVVLQLIARGLSNKEIALEMNIALSTVKTHIHNIYNKLNITKRAQAVIKARELQL